MNRLTRYAIALAATIGIWYAYAANAQEQQTPAACGAHDEVVKALGDKFHEATSSVALTSAGTLLEVLTAEDGATWTIIVTRPDGLSCVVAAGQNWQDKKPATEPQADATPEADKPSKYPGVDGNANVDPDAQFEIDWDFQIEGFGGIDGTFPGVEGIPPFGKESSGIYIPII